MQKGRAICICMQFQSGRGAQNGTGKYKILSKF